MPHTSGLCLSVSCGALMLRLCGKRGNSLLRFSCVLRKYTSAGTIPLTPHAHAHPCPFPFLHSGGARLGWLGHRHKGLHFGYELCACTAQAAP